MKRKSSNDDSANEFNPAFEISKGQPGAQGSPALWGSGEGHPCKSVKCVDASVFDACQPSASSSHSFQEAYQNVFLEASSVDDGTGTGNSAEVSAFQDACVESIVDLPKVLQSEEEYCNLEAFMPPNCLQSVSSVSDLNIISYGNGDADENAELHCFIDANNNQGMWETSPTCNILDMISPDSALPLSFDGLMGLLADFSTLQSPYFPLDTVVNPTESCMMLPYLGASMETGTSFNQVAPTFQNSCFNNAEVLEWLNKHIVVEDMPGLSDVNPANCPDWLPKAQETKKTLVLDLDETLVHSSLEPSDDADFSFPVFFEMKDRTVYVRQRPYLHTFLQKVSEMFEVVIFTASQSVYASKLLDVLDPEKKFISQRIYRESCTFSDGSCTKDLTILGVDLAKIAIIDNTPQVFRLQVNNGIPIKSWYDDRSDNALLQLLPFLESLVDVEDVRPIIAEKFADKNYC